MAIGVQMSLEEFCRAPWPWKWLVNRRPERTLPRLAQQIVSEASELLGYHVMPADQQRECGREIFQIRGGAITLIELLVVIAIVAVLAALLLSALAAAKWRADSEVCKSNLHQMEIATTLYVGDFDAHSVGFARAVGSGEVIAPAEMIAFGDAFRLHEAWQELTFLAVSELPSSGFRFHIQRAGLALPMSITMMYLSMVFYRGGTAAAGTLFFVIAI